MAAEIDRRERSFQMQFERQPLQMDQDRLQRFDDLVFVSCVAYPGSINKRQHNAIDAATAASLE